MTAIDAEFVNYKHIPTRKAFQIVLEVNEERQREVFECLGYPITGQSMRVAVTRLHEEPPAMCKINP